MSEAPRVAVLTVSDRCSCGEAQDTSGPALVELVQRMLGAEIVGAACVTDDADAIQAQIQRWVSMESRPDLIVTTGGTGLGPRDVTPEAVGALLEREAPGLMEHARRAGAAKTAHAALSRGVAGTIGRTLVLTLPGSTKGAVESLEALVEILAHAIGQVRGEEGGHSRTGACH